MQTVVIVIHLMVIVALIAVVLLQRSEGGALGIGGSNSMLTARGQGNILTKATTILGVAFFATSIAMSVLARLDAPPSAILEGAADVAPIQAPAGDGATTPASSDGLTNGPGILDELERATGETLDGPAQVPTTQ